MIKFRDWLNSRELVDSKIEEINFRGLVAGGAMLAGLAGGARASEPYNFAGEKLVRMGSSEKNLQQDEIFIKSWQMMEQNITSEIKKNPNIEFLFIEVTSEHHDGKKIGVVTLKAKVRAADEITAKQILIREITRSAAKVGLQAEAIRGLKQIFSSNVRNENSNSEFNLKLVIMSDRAYWS